MSFMVREAIRQDATRMQAAFKQMGWSKPDGYFEACCQAQEAGALVLLVAEKAGAYVGHLKVVWQPDYPFFKTQGIPEIQDLNVLPTYRRQGVATKLVEAAEALIRQRSRVVGIGVGLYASYGPAQRMYILRGYIPDGHGATYRGTTLSGGETVMVDDDLVIYLTRTFAEI
jgi:GNAT superfamily N-acetyltransferase